MSQEPPLTIGAVARRYGYPPWHIRRLSERGLLPPAPRVDAYWIFLPIRLGWFRFNLRFRDRGIPSHFGLDARFPVGSGVEDFKRLVSQGVATPCDLRVIVPLGLHARAVSPDDAPLTPSSA